MAARTRKVKLTDSWKDGIKTSVIMTRLYKHVTGETEMTMSQINAAKVVLAKLVPDLARQEVTGEDGGPQVHEFSWRE